MDDLEILVMHFEQDYTGEWSFLWLTGSPGMGSEYDYVGLEERWGEELVSNVINSGVTVGTVFAMYEVQDRYTDDYMLVLKELHIEERKD